MLFKGKCWVGILLQQRDVIGLRHLPIMFAEPEL
jgi:hypothetical protein